MNSRDLLRLWLVAPLVVTIAGCGLLPKPATPTAAIVAPTQPPAATPTVSNVLYEDPFTDPASGWATVTSEMSKSGYHPPDAFHLEASAPNTTFWVFRKQDFADFSAETQVFLDSAADGGQWRHGLAFRQASDGHFYAFLINPRAQSWQVVKRAGDAWQTLAEGNNAGIVAEPKVINTLRVDAGGSSLTFSINAQPVVTVNDGEFTSGDIGFVVETFDQTKAHLHFDSVIVRKFDASVMPPAPTAGPVSTATPTPTGTATPTATRAPGAGGGGGGGGGGGTTNPTAIARTVAAEATAISRTAAALVRTACAIAGSPCP